MFRGRILGLKAQLLHEFSGLGAGVQTGFGPHVTVRVSSKIRAHEASTYPVVRLINSHLLTRLSQLKRRGQARNTGANDGCAHANSPDAMSRDDTVWTSSTIRVRTVGSDVGRTP